MRVTATVGLLVLVAAGAAAGCASLSYDGLGETATTSPSPSAPATPIGQLFSSDFEQDDGGILTTITVSGAADSWAWGVPVGGAHSGTHAWATALAGSYLQGEKSCLALPLVVPSNGAVVTSWVAYSLETGWDYFDLRVCDALGNCPIVEQHMGKQGFAEYQTSLAGGGAQSIEWCVDAEGLFPEDGITVDDVTATAN